MFAEVCVLWLENLLHCVCICTYIRMYVCNCECTYIYVAGAVALTLEQAEQEEREKDLKSDKRGLKTELREMELAHEAAVKKLKLVCMYICTSVHLYVDGAGMH